METEEECRRWLRNWCRKQNGPTLALTDAVRTRPDGTTASGSRNRADYRTIIGCRRADPSAEDGMCLRAFLSEQFAPGRLDGME